MELRALCDQEKRAKESPAIITVILDCAHIQVDVLCGVKSPRGPLSPRAGGGVGAGPPALSLRVPLIFIKALKASPLASQTFD